MKDFLEFTFKSFWHFVGVFILLEVVVSGVVKVLAIVIALMKSK